MITIVGIADTHMAHHLVKPPEADILVVAGDFLGHGRLHEVPEFNDWLGRLPHKHKIVIAGNHDKCCVGNKHSIRAVLTNALYLECDAVTVMGIKFYGCPWTPNFYNWAFMYDRGGEQAKKIWGAVPEDTNVLITHGPPAGLAIGRTKDHHYEPGEDAGCPIQRNRIEQLPKLKATFCGHIHIGYGVAKLGDVVCHNVAVCDEHYDVTRHGLVYEYKGE